MSHGTQNKRHIELSAPFSLLTRDRALAWQCYAMVLSFPVGENAGFGCSNITSGFALVHRCNCCTLPTYVSSHF
ncbi:hypothetical protein Cob_v005495 [Colletotrichum orbiculare MAFF 240422]|uniref:Uncharacterized protein n=1 Tax=Colletotrichum orbiculare (strain 104-T / ATCC 96160 / CBS 514.97 / LARS 414 / MAFF 240422) TaxID=1213857 RepID=A0A484FUR1_COLOR|nr:hypothetical protein Cob_v005495 [Colletotrichum orbiculare MAFF 240422]